MGKEQKGGTIDGLTTSVYMNDSTHCVTLVYDHQIYNFELLGVCSEAFRKTNGVATAYFGKTTAPKWHNKKDLGI